MTKINIVEFSGSPPPSPVTPTPQPRKNRPLHLAVEILATAASAALTASKILRKDCALALISICLSTQAAEAAYRIKPIGNAKIVGALGVVAAMALTGGETLTKAANAGLVVVALLEELSPSQENLTLKQGAAMCADVALGIFASSIGIGFIQPQMDPDALIAGMVVGHAIYKLVLNLFNSS